MQAQKVTGKVGFFVTPFGRKLIFYTAGATTVGLSLVNFLPHTLFLKYYQDFVTCYQNGVERQVADKVKLRLEKAMDILELRQYERKLIKPFSAFGFDLFHAGSLKYRFGCALGIPVNYNYSSARDINHAEIRFRDKSINWDSETGKLLEDAIVLTEDEQTFGLCKIILQLRTNNVFWNSIFPSASFLTMYTLGRYLNLSLNLYARPFTLRLVMYSILGLFGLGSWSFLKDFNQVNSDADIDKQLSKLGPEFVQAGISYYDKLLKKNMALRALIGDATYTAKGNENYLIRQKTLPLTIRKSFFEEKWKELKEGTNASESTTTTMPQ